MSRAFSHNRLKTSSTRQSSCRPSLEVLERREVPTIGLAGGVLTIHGADDANTIIRIDQNSTPGIPWDDKVIVTSVSPGDYEAKTFQLYNNDGIPGVKAPTRHVTNISFFGSSGNDIFRNMTDIKAYAYGGPGNDRLYAGSGGDHLFSGTGSNQLFGGAGKDTLSADGNANTLVSIGGGADSVYGSTGMDDFWCDSTDYLGGVSAAEKAGGCVHCVSSFMSYSYSGGIIKLPVNLELYGQSLLDPLPAAPGLKLTNFKTMPLFGSKGPDITDVQQGDIGDCYFLATLGAMARTNPGRIQRLVASLGDGTYAVHFYDANGKSVFVRVDADLWTYPDKTPAYAKFGSQDSLWVPIVEKAWAFYRNQMGSYASISGGNSPGVALDKALNLKQPSQVTNTNIIPPQAYLLAIQSSLSQGKAVTFGGPAGFTDNTAKTSTTFHRGQHIYAVEKVLTDVNNNPTGIVLYNPYGFEVTITKLDLISYCSGGFAAYNV